MAKKKRQDIDIDDLIEERVAAVLSDRLAEIDYIEDATALFSKVLCRDCMYWEVSAI